jgi:hypothetical protein
MSAIGLVTALLTSVTIVASAYAQPVNAESQQTTISRETVRAACAFNGLSRTWFGSEISNRILDLEQAAAVRRDALKTRYDRLNSEIERFQYVLDHLRGGRRGNPSGSVPSPDEECAQTYIALLKSFDAQLKEAEAAAEVQRAEAWRKASEEATAAALTRQAEETARAQAEAAAQKEVQRKAAEEEAAAALARQAFETARAQAEAAAADSAAAEQAHQQKEAADKARTNANAKAGALRSLGITPTKTPTSFDILGLKFGMTPLESVEVLQKYNKNGRQEVHKEISATGITYVSWIRYFVALEPASAMIDPLFIGDFTDAWFTGPSSGNVLVRVERFVNYRGGNGPGIEKTTLALQEKYGKSPVSNQGTLHYSEQLAFDRNGKLIPNEVMINCHGPDRGLDSPVACGAFLFFYNIGYHVEESGIKSVGGIEMFWEDNYFANAVSRLEIEEKQKADAEASKKRTDQAPAPPL